MTINPEITVLVDWDGDFFPCIDAAPGDALNIVPTPVDWSLLTLAGDTGNETVENIWSKSRVGLRQSEVQVTAGMSDGLKIGDGTDIPVSSSTQYTAAVWARQEGALDGVPFTLAAYDQGDNLLGSASISGIANDTGFQGNKHTLTLTTGGSSTHIYLKVIKDSDTTSGTFYISGPLVVAGSSVPDFNAGVASNRYDNVTSFTKMLNCDLGGSGDINQFMAKEGTCSVTLNNEDKTFSPENNSSDIFGSFLPYRRIEVRCDGTTLWNGWTKEFDVTTGTNRKVEATIKGEQGLNRLASSTFDFPIQQNLTSGEVVDQLISQSGWYSPEEYGIGLVGISRVGGCRIGLVESFTQLDNGLTAFNYIGHTWKTGTGKVSNAIRDVVEAERGLFFLDRLGKVVFRDRDYVLGLSARSTTPDEILSLETDVNSSKYIFGERLYNKIEVQYRPVSVKTVEVWDNTDNPITVSNGESVEKRLTFEYEEGTQINVLSIDSVTISPSSVGYSIDLSNDKATLTLTNNTGSSQDVTLTINGNAVVYRDPQIVVEEDTDQQEVLRSILKFSKDYSLIQDETEAQTLANRLLLQHRRPFGHVKNFTVKSRDTSWLTRQLKNPVDRVVRLEDTQVGISGSDGNHLLTGASYNWKPGLLTTEFETIRTNLYGVIFTLGESRIGSEDLLDI